MRRWGPSSFRGLTAAASLKRLKTFKTKKQAQDFESTTRIDIKNGTHIADGDSITVADAGKLWLATCEDGLKRSSIARNRNHVDLHIDPLIGPRGSPVRVPRSPRGSDQGDLARRAGRMPVLQAAGARPLHLAHRIRWRREHLPGAARLHAGRHRRHESPRRKPARRPLPDHLPGERRVVPSPTACPCCGGRLRKLGEDTTEMLERVPAQWKVIQIVREKMTCRASEAITQAPAPSHPIGRGRAGPQLLADVLFGKYGAHLPLNRQSDIYAREGVERDVSTLADWVGACAATLMPLRDAAAAVRPRNVGTPAASRVSTPRLQ